MKTDFKTNQKQQLINTIGDIQYKNRTDWFKFKNKVLFYWTDIWEQPPFSLTFRDKYSPSEQYMKWLEKFSDLINEYITVLLKEQLGNKLFNQTQKSKKEMEKKMGFPITTSFESKLYNRLYRSLYWGWIKKSEYSNLNT